MAVFTDQTADDFAGISGPGTFTVGSYGIDPNGNKSGNIEAQLCGLDSGNNSVHGTISAGWKMVGGVLTVAGVTIVLSVIPLSLTGLVMTLDANGNDIRIRVTLLLGQSVQGAYSFSVLGSG